MASVVVLMPTTARDGKRYQTLMLPIAMASGWLFTIRRVSPKVQVQLDRFRLEACLALDLWFRRGGRDKALPAIQAGDYEIPRSFAQALELAAKQARELEETRPKAAVFDHAFAHEELSLTEFARTLDGVNTRQVKAVLCDLGYLYKGPVSSSWYARSTNAQTFRVYAKYRDVLFTEKLHPEYGTATIYLTSKGKQLVASLYREGRLPMKASYREAINTNFFVASPVRSARPSAGFK